ncbi:hypothetical protein MNBD_GAMMA02-999, partial [hydrothermal vent metagenome]
RIRDIKWVFHARIIHKNLASLLFAAEKHNYLTIQFLINLLAYQRQVDLYAKNRLRKMYLMSYALICFANQPPCIFIILFHFFGLLPLLLVAAYKYNYLTGQLWVTCWAF